MILFAKARSRPPPAFIFANVRNRLFARGGRYHVCRMLFGILISPFRIFLIVRNLLRFILLADQVFAHFFRNVAPPQLVSADPGDRVFPAGERNFLYRIGNMQPVTDGISIVTVHDHPLPDKDRLPAPVHRNI